MRLLVVFSLLAGLKAQYVLEGHSEDRAQKAEYRFTWRLAPSYLRLVHEGTFDGKGYLLDFLFTLEAQYWLDPLNQVAYRVEVPPQEPPLYSVEKVESVTHRGRSAVRAFFALAEDKRMEVVWDTTASFSWVKWLRFFKGDGLPVAAAYFRNGLPLAMRVYKEDGTLLQMLEVENITPFTPKTSEAQPPYPVREFGK